MFHVFLLCSGSAAIVNLLVGFLLYNTLGLSSPAGYAFSVSAAFLAGIGVSFILNRRFTFPPSGRTVRFELRDFLIVSIGGLMLTTGLSLGFATFGASLLAKVTAGMLPLETAAHISAVGLTAFYSFFAHKYVSFRRHRLWAMLRQEEAKIAV